jgi:hypothetical protein
MILMPAENGQTVQKLPREKDDRREGRGVEFAFFGGKK